MKKNLRLSLIAAACTLAITACSSDNKGATRYEDLVKAKAEESAKKSAEAAEQSKQSETEKRLAELEKQIAEQKNNSNTSNSTGTSDASSAGTSNPTTEKPTTKPTEESKATTPTETPKAEALVDKPSTESKAETENKAETEKTENTEKSEAEAETKANVNALTAEQAKTELAKGFKDNGVDGNIIKLSGSIATATNDSFTVASISENTSQNLNELIVDGKTVVLYSSQDLINGRTNEEELTKDIANHTGRVGSLPKSSLKSNFEQMRYGYVTENGKTTLFVQGFMTPTTGKEDTQSPFNYYDASKGKPSSTQRLSSMPTTGLFEYQGKAFYGKDNQYSELNATAYADITNKKVQVNLEDNSTKLTFGGVIHDNKFSGTVGDVVTEGAFYGTGAKDLGGTFYNISEGKNGVYGASQKDCGWLSCAKPEVDLTKFEVTQ